MKLTRIIQQLSEQDYKKVLHKLKENKAKKNLILIRAYRNGDVSENKIMKQLGVTKSSFHTLRSRLLNKVQEYLYSSVSVNKIEISQNVANIDYIIHKKPLETAIAVLNKLEFDLIKNDMPEDLISVYQALKSVHINSPKYYEYEQKYNRQIAYYLAQNKAKDTLSLFCKTLSEYCLNKSEEKTTLLVLYLNKINNLNKLYNSHHILLYKNILSIHYLLFLDNTNNFIPETAEMLLSESKSIIEKHKDDKVYPHYTVVLDFLSFEYYLYNGSYQKANELYDILCNNIDSLFLLGHCCFSYKFLFSKIKWDYIIHNNKADSIVFEHYNVNNNPISRIYWNLYTATKLYYENNYKEAIEKIKPVLNEISFKEYNFIEHELKLFLILLYMLTDNKKDVASLIRSIERKIKEEQNSAISKNVNRLLLLLKMINASKNNELSNKIKTQLDVFNALNTGNCKILQYVLIDESRIQRILKNN